MATTGKKSAAKKSSPRPAAAAKSGGKAAKPGRMIYFFGATRCDGDGTMKPLLGGKGANLAQMTKIGLPVPPGFTITTAVCIDFYTNHKKFPHGLEDEVRSYVRLLEKESGKKFGDPTHPLLVSVRSGARDSMPGMMDTILNLGLNDRSVEGLAKATGNPRFAYDSYRRFIQMYGDVVMGVQKRHENEDEPFEEVMEKLKHEHGVHEDTDLSSAALQELIRRYLVLIKERTKKAFPQDPFEQLMGAVGAVFGSWMNERAILYRRKYKIPDEWGTAVNVQTMVFGNMGDDCATGVAFTRDPATGEDVFYGEYLVNAQGEDVVAGVRTPKPVVAMADDPGFASTYKQLEKVRERLEKKFGDVQDFEFTVEKKKLYMLQTRHGKRTALAYVKIAHDMVKQKLMSPEHAIQSADPDALSQLLAPIFDRHDYEAARKSTRLLTTGLPAGPGAATGQLVFTAAKAEELSAKGEKVVLARVETSPEDLRGMIAAEGILTSRGGVSSHAALVARQMGKVCVAGAGALVIHYGRGTLTCNGTTLREGDAISINGSTGEVFAGGMKTADSELKQVLITRSMKPQDSQVFQYYDFIMKLADKHRKLGLRTNADTPEQVRHAIAFGAEGIGLTRTEHMFFEGDRIDAMREMILADGEAARRAALAKLLPYQREDFEGIFRALEGRPATIRFLDPPLHEFVPHDDKAQADLARKLGIPAETVRARVHALHEFNPMLGHRGCRLGISYPEISEMQTRAVFEAAAKVQKDGIKVKPEIMIPLVGFKKELDNQVAIVHEVAAKVQKETGEKIKYLVGTMIEIPRGALTADEIAGTAEFFSFGTNDLTQTCLGMSRDDMGSFLGKYTEEGIFKANPFASLDTTGVGQLMHIAVEKGRQTRPDIKLGICGEHGGDPHSVVFCHHVGLDYVSCSPFRLPVARLAAAQAALGKTY
ncbi:MAG: pyruvate, phosphate dikinase [Planctomycetia bacterium]|nr:pyruvate, phosphate dikinase [Planctomycetia bacterium]